MVGGVGGWRGPRPEPKGCADPPANTTNADHSRIVPDLIKSVSRSTKYEVYEESHSDPVSPPPDSTMTTFAVREGRDQAHHLPAPSPSSNTFTDSALGSDMMDNKKGHLLRRWNQMLSCIARTSLEDRAVTAMHKHLDEVENLISWDIMDENRRVDETDGLGISGLSTEDSVYFEENITPAASIAPDAPERMCRSGWMEETSVEAQALLLRVTEAANQLRCRQGEFQVSGSHRQMWRHGWLNKTYSICTISPSQKRRPEPKE